MKAIKQKLRDTKKDMLKAEKDAKKAERDREQTEKENELLEKSQIIIGLVAFSMVLLTMFLRYRTVQSKKVILKQAQLEAAEQEQEILALTVKEENRNVQALSLELLVKQDFSKSLLVGIILPTEIFPSFVSQSLLFLSFLIATFVPTVIWKLR